MLMQKMSDAGIPQDDGWVIENDQQAEWAIKKIEDSEAELEKWRSFYLGRVAALEEEYSRLYETMRRKLADYFQTVPHRETKTQFKYSLPSADLIQRKAKETWERDDSRLIEWLKENNYSESIKVSTSVNWKAAKEHLEVDESGTVVDKDTGEICEAVTFKTEPGEFVLSIKN